MANETTLTGSIQPIPIAEGYTLQAPGLVGTAQKVDKATSNTRSALRAGQSTDPFAAALLKTNANLEAHFELNIQGGSPTAPSIVGTRSPQLLKKPVPTTPSALEFATPKPPANTQSIVLHTAENGEMQWIWPHKTDAQKSYFNLPAASAPPAGHVLPP